MKLIHLTFAFLLFASNISAQKVTKLTITDNLSTASRFSYGKAKPAPAKDHFYILSDKGTQVLFYAELNSTDSTSLSYSTLKFTAYKTNSGKDEWVDDRVIDIKIGSTYVMTAFNFSEIGNYKIIIGPEIGNEILAQGTFVITK